LTVPVGPGGKGEKEEELAEEGRGRRMMIEQSLKDAERRKAKMTERGLVGEGGEAVVEAAVLSEGERRDGRSCFAHLDHSSIEG
jgi:hypothetical protein